MLDGIPCILWRMALEFPLASIYQYQYQYQYQYKRGSAAQHDTALLHNYQSIFTCYKRALRTEDHSGTHGAHCAWRSCGAPPPPPPLGRRHACGVRAARSIRPSVPPTDSVSCIARHACGAPFSPWVCPWSPSVFLLAACGWRRALGVSEAGVHVSMAPKKMAT